MDDEHSFIARSKARSRACLAAFVACMTAAFAASPSAAPATFAQLEAEGAVIGSIRIDARDIFDLDDPREASALFRLVNRLHLRTNEDVIRRLLLFKTGDPISARVIDETERILRANRFLYDVAINPVRVHDSVVDIEVVTRDTWTLDLTGRFGRAGGTNTTAFGVLDYNVLGTGSKLGISQVSDVDRHGTQVVASYAQAFDGWTAIDLLSGRYSDGDRSSASVVRPFYSLDTRWAAGASWDRWNRVESIYNAGDAIAKYRHRSEVAEVFGGWSRGIVRGWTQRFSAGIAMHDDAYGTEPSQAAPRPVPSDHDLHGFFVRHEAIEESFVKVRNRDQIARPEFFEMGLVSRVQVTRAVPGLGASRAAWLYSISVSKGFSLPHDQDVLATATLQRQLASAGMPLASAGTQVRYFAPQNPNAAFYAALSADRVGAGAQAADQLLLGGDNGLRGYPLRYQSGDRRALVTIEERVYTDWYPFRLARVGAAVFFDRGRAWGGVNQNSVNGGWLSDAGVGLRVALDRAAFGNVLHADIAVPMQRVPGIKAVQFLVKTQITF